MSYKNVVAEKTTVTRDTIHLEDKTGNIYESIVAMSKSLALEYAKKNININCISPGFIKTEMTDKIEEKFDLLYFSSIWLILYLETRYI